MPEAFKGHFTTDDNGEIKARRNPNYNGEFFGKKTEKIWQ